MFDQCTDRMKKVIALARDRATQLHHNYVSTGHLLLGLLDEGTGVAVNVLKNDDIDLDRVRHEVESRLRPGVSLAGAELLPFTPGAKSTLDLSLAMSESLGHNFIGTEHLLLGLVAEGQGMAAQILDAHGARLDDLRADVVEFMG